MELYAKKSRWKLYLFLAAMVILAISTIYTNHIATKLAQGERDKADVWAKTMERMQDVNADLNEDVTLAVEAIKNPDMPIIMVNERGKIAESLNFPENTDLEVELKKMKNSDLQPLEGTGYARFTYYKHSPTLTLLTYFPIIQIIFFAVFAGIGYLLFSAARRSEQNQVWVGMAKETAHQLGTPISGIIGWIDHLRMLKPEEDEVQEVLDELGNDVERLNLIADRFSKIGSEPKLTPINIYQELDACRNYMQRRASRKTVFDFPSPDKSLNVNINPPLFAWVVENLLRNALDAMDGKGKISAQVSEEDKFVNIEISDTGKGIPSNKFKTVFEPGFTTKKRGWGLGLSLAKRIIESYHSGRIFVKKSGVGEGTTFVIKLPKG